MKWAGESGRAPWTRALTRRSRRAGSLQLRSRSFFLCEHDAQTCLLLAASKQCGLTARCCCIGRSGEVQQWRQRCQQRDAGAPPPAPAPPRRRSAESHATAALQSLSLWHQVAAVPALQPALAQLQHYCLLELQQLQATAACCAAAVLAQVWRVCGFEVTETAAPHVPGHTIRHE